MVMISHLSFSQNFDFSSDSDANWTINAFSYGYCYKINPFGIIGDTLIENNVYHKIYQSNDSIWNPLNSKYFCAFRQQNEKWFFVNKEDTTQYLLYDFNVSVNDTIQFNGNPWTFTDFETMGKVIAVDSVLIQDLYRKRIQVTSITGGFSEYWIEGIGSTNGLFYSANYWFDSEYQLMYFYENDSLLYENEPYGECLYLPLGNEEIELDTTIEVYPNPAHDKTTLNVNDLNFKAFNVELYNSNGQLIDSKLDNYSTINFELSNYTAGLYLLKIELENNDVVTKKLIIK